MSNAARRSAQTLRTIMITIPQKMILSFLFSVFLFTGIAVLVFFGIFDLGAVITVLPQQLQVLIAPASFFALFLIIFLYLNLRQDSGEEDIPRLMEFGGLELADEGEVVELEDISPNSGGNTSILGGRFFAFSPGNPELLQAAGNEVIYEHNGIHYINDNAFNSDKNTKREINKDFAKLVESVVRA
jgi:hypothetical protein